MQRGFTLAELLIALVILGVIATFTIPKVLTSQQDTKSKAIAKETAGMISAAYQAYQKNSAPDQNMSSADLTPFINYIRVDTSSTVDDSNGGTTLSCSGTFNCLHMANGSVFVYQPPISFGGTAITNGIHFYVDPDGVYGGSSSGPSKSVQFWLYFNGRITTNGTISANTCDSFGCYGPNPPSDPSWFSWN